MRRIPAQRLVGLAVVAAVLAAATQFLAHAFDTGLLIDTDTADRLNRWIDRAPTAWGSGILGGVALVLAGVTVVVGNVRLRSRGTGTITTRRKDGKTRIDRRTLRHALERELATVDQRADVIVNIRRRGRTDLVIVTPDPTRTGTAVDVRQRLDEICTQRSLPLRSGRVTTSVPRKTTGRRRVR